MHLKLLAYVVPLLLFFFWVLRNRKLKYRKNQNSLRNNQKEGLTEPASLHPVINPAMCIGCGSCVSACPEGNVLGLIDGRAQLVHPTHCIGHGACKDACPMHAIELVFGTEKRGVDIPNVKPNFETNMSGIFIAGELGGMGLIRNAVEQGRLALDSIISSLDKSPQTDDMLDLVIVGAGPAGFAAALGAVERKLKFVVLEQDTLGGTVAHFPRGKIVMTQPVEMPIMGKVNFSETTKEELLAFWESAERRSKVLINYRERVASIQPESGGYSVQTDKGHYTTRKILLAIGRRGTPRKLGAVGEDLPKVVYRLTDPEQYQGSKVLVVGGGDSALEAAASIAQQPGAVVTLSYRSQAFSRAKAKNRERIAMAEQAGNLRVVYQSQVKEILQHKVLLDTDDGELAIANDTVIISAGGIVPTPFLEKTGIQVETKHGEA